MKLAIAAMLAASCLLAGCDGGLHFDGQVLTPQGKPAANTPIYFYYDDKADERDPILWTDAKGKFELGRIDCTCDFAVELIAADANNGIGRVLTTHKALEKHSNVLIQLGARPTPPVPVEKADSAALCPNPEAKSQ